MSQVLLECKLDRKFQLGEPIHRLILRSLFQPRMFQKFYPILSKHQHSFYQYNRDFFHGELYDDSVYLEYIQEVRYF